MFYNHTILPLADCRLLAIRSRRAILDSAEDSFSSLESALFRLPPNPRRHWLLCRRLPFSEPLLVIAQLGLGDLHVLLYTVAVISVAVCQSLDGVEDGRAKTVVPLRHR